MSLFLAKQLEMYVVYAEPEVSLHFLATNYNSSFLRVDR